MIYYKIKYNLIRSILYLLLFKKRGYGCEIGVWKGSNAKILYKLLYPKLLYLIDPYVSKNCDDVYAPRLSQTKMNEMYNEVKKWAENKRIWFIKDTSKSASEYVGKRKVLLDWAYIDGDHFDLYNDLIYWYKNVSGIIMGDDYKGYPQVKNDVNKFCKERGIKLRHLHNQWWFKI